MTREFQKNEEIRFFNLAKNVMKANWEIKCAQECPDFEIISGDQCFGLEVVEFYKGKISNKKGSSLRKKEIKNQKDLNELREKYIKKYPELTNWTMDYGLNKIDEAEISCAIEKIDFNNPITIVYRQEISNEDRLKANSKINLPDGFHLPDEFIGLDNMIVLKYYPPGSIVRGNLWLFNEDVSPLTEIDGESENVICERIQEIIDNKAERKKKYKIMNDIRLLIVSSFQKSSSNALPKEGFLPDIKTFTKVYFLHTPNVVIEYPTGKTYLL
ncbi:hypothetical protein ZMO3_ZMOp41x038 (plasmid) [Zymomonas mobilis subsp. mobilis]|uniref:hypothetical protein n=1 Tax=Zymomonas mobilis TaxID=542 RepID=UPI000D211CD1|nr:hypothetical protein [Zymomonas mobilis]AVZ28815.1 hypothetical protein ZMO3_ZMOp41x038 [Zymomonas mobilis subsp. mobilis]